MTTWTDVTAVTSSYSDPISADGYVVAGYVQVGYILGSDQWSTSSAASSTFTSAATPSTTWTSVTAPTTTWA